MRKIKEKNKVGRPKLADNNLKKKSYKTLGLSLILILGLIFGGFLSLFNINTSNLKGNINNDVYDVILFFGQSNMVGHSGRYKTKGDKAGEDKYDQRLKELGASKFSMYTNIDESIVQNYNKVDHVNVNITKSSAYEYKYLNNSLSEIKKDTKYLGETLKYSNSKLISVNDSTYDTRMSYGTNMIPQFAKTYYEQTGHKVIAVMAAHGAYQIDKFQPKTTLYKTMKIKYNAAINYLNKNKYTVANRYYVVFQGEADVSLKTRESDYYNKFMNIHNSLKKDTKITHGFIVQTSTLDGTSRLSNVKIINNAQKRLILNNADISLASDYPYRSYTPSRDQYNSSEFSNQNIDYETALDRSRLSKCITPVKGNKNAIHFNSAALSQIGHEAAINSSRITNNKPGCKINVKYNRNVSYRIKCLNGYKVTKAYYVISDEVNQLKNTKGTINPGINLVKRKMIIYANYINNVTGSKKLAKSSVITINRTPNVIHVTEPTNCKIYTYNVIGTTANWAIKCDRSATPQKVSLLYDKSERIIDKKWYKHYGFWNKDYKIAGLIPGKDYYLRVSYNFLDKLSANNSKIVKKYDSYITKFTAGKNDNQLSKLVDNSPMDSENKCNISLSKVNTKQINYIMKCEKKAKPISLDIVTKYPETQKIGSRAYSSTIKISYKSRYLNGAIFERNDVKDDGTIRMGYLTEAKTKNADIWGIYEEGTITGLNSDLPYQLNLYYTYNKNGKLIHYVKTSSNIVNVY